MGIQQIDDRQTDRQSKGSEKTLPKEHNNRSLK